MEILSTFKEEVETLSTGSVYHPLDIYKLPTHLITYWKLESPKVKRETFPVGLLLSIKIFYSNLPTIHVRLWSIINP